MASALTPPASSCWPPSPPPTMRSFSFLLAYSTADLRRGHRVLRIGDRGRSGEQRREPLELRAGEGEPREPVLGHLEAGAGVAHLPPQVRHLRDREPGLVGDDDASVQQRCAVRDQLLFDRSTARLRHDLAALAGSVARGARKLHPSACPRSRRRLTTVRPVSAGALRALAGDERRHLHLGQDGNGRSHDPSSRTAEAAVVTTGLGRQVEAPV